MFVYLSCCDNATFIGRAETARVQGGRGMVFADGVGGAVSYGAHDYG